MRTTIDGEQLVEQFTAGGGRGIVLRFGSFLASDAHHTDDYLRLARRHLAPGAGRAPAATRPRCTSRTRHPPSSPRSTCRPVSTTSSTTSRSRRREFADAVRGRVRLRPSVHHPALAGEAVGALDGRLPAPVAARLEPEVPRRDGVGSGLPERTRRLGRRGLRSATACDTNTTRRCPVREQFSRILLGVLAASCGVRRVLGRTRAAVRSTTTSPGTNHPWVSPDGPFNEHLVRDVGWLNLALALVALIAAVSLARAAVGAAAGCGDRRRRPAPRVPRRPPRPVRHRRPDRERPDPRRRARSPA